MKDSKRSFYLFFRDYWTIILLISVVVIFFFKSLFLGKILLPADIIVGAYYPWLDYSWGFPAGVPVKNPITSDSISFIYPMRTLAVSLIESGQFPLWNPYILNGTPLLANFQSAVFSPTNVFYFMLDRFNAWNLQVITQHLLAALFSFFLLRHWKVSKIGSVFAGTAYAFSGFMLIWSQWNAHSLTAAFLPLLFLFTDRWIEKQRVVDGMAVSIVLALQIFSGYPQIVIYSLLAVGLYSLYKLGFKPRLNSIRKYFGVSLFLILGLGLASVQLLPSIELLGLSQRNVEIIPIRWAFLKWNELITFIAPDYFGNHATANYWGDKNYLSSTGFIGVVVLILASTAVVHLFLTVFKKTPDFQSGDELNADMSSSFRGNPAFLSGEDVTKIKDRQKQEFSKVTPFLIILAFVSLILSFPTFVGKFIWTSGMLGLSAGVSFRALVLFSFSMSALSGFGVDVLMKLSKAKKINKIYLISLIAPLLILISYGIYTLILYLLYLKSPGVFDPYVRGINSYIVGLRNLVFPAFIFLLASIVYVVVIRYKKLLYLGLFVIYFILTFELFRFGWKFTPLTSKELVYPKTPVIDYLVNQEKPFRALGIQVMPVNQNLPFRLEFVGGYDAVTPLLVAKFVAVLNSNNAGADPQDRYVIVNNINSPLNDLMNLKYLLVKSDYDFDKDKFVMVYEDKSVLVLENENALDRAFMVYDWEVVKSSEEQLKMLIDKSFPADEKVVLSQDVGLVIKDRKEAPFSEVEYLSYRNQESLMKVETDDDGLLFISDTYYPGWRAYVDGREQEIHRANYAFRAIEIQKGKHEVQMVYEPESFSIGLRVSAVSLMLLLLILVSPKILARVR